MASGWPLVRLDLPGEVSEAPRAMHPLAVVPVSEAHPQQQLANSRSACRSAPPLDSRAGTGPELPLNPCSGISIPPFVVPPPLARAWQLHSRVCNEPLRINGRAAVQQPSATAGGEQLPAAWLAQLAPGGRLVAPVQHGGGQRLVVVDQAPQGLVTHELEAVQFVPLKSGVA